MNIVHYSSTIPMKLIRQPSRRWFILDTGYRFVALLLGAWWLDRWMETEITLRRRRLMMRVLLKKFNSERIRESFYVSRDIPSIIALPRFFCNFSTMVSRATKYNIRCITYGMYCRYHICTILAECETRMQARHVSRATAAIRSRAQRANVAKLL